jgi:hypothetical protein
MAFASFEVTYKMTYESAPLAGSVRGAGGAWLRLAILRKEPPQDPQEQEGLKHDRTSFARH